MAKIYKNIQAFLGIEALEVPSDNSIYLVEALCDKLEERIGQAVSKEETLTAKMDEIVKLNDTIKELRDSLTEKDAALEEKEGTINGLNEQVTALNDQITALNNDVEGKDNANTEKDNQIAALNDEVANLKQSLEDKDAEIAKLAGKAPAVPASGEEANAPADEEKNEDMKPHNVTHAGMSLKEETEAIKARYAALNGQA